MAVRIAYSERELQRTARKLGGTWYPDVRLWHIRYGAIKGTELEKHMILDADQKGIKK